MQKIRLLELINDELIQNIVEYPVHIMVNLHVITIRNN